MKLLVTGGAGYIGSVVAAQLVDAGHAVVIVDNLSRGHAEAVPAGARFVRGDLLDLAGMKAILDESFDGVLHFAALSLVAESVVEPAQYYRNNVCGTLNLLEAMRAVGAPKLVFSSTAAVYGIPDCVPIPESAAPRPINPYGGSKLAIDELFHYAATAYRLAAVSLRYFNVAGASNAYGEAHQPETHLIPLVLQTALGQRGPVAIYGSDYATQDGTAVRDYIHVEDLARAHLLALAAARVGEHLIYNLGNGTGFSVREVIDTARHVTGRDIPVVASARRPGDPPVLVAASDKARLELGWTPEKPALETMIADAWQWLQTHHDF
jgi:UDP-glucose 4-epimerase